MSVNELWNELVVLIRSISADLSGLDAESKFSTTKKFDTVASLLSEIAEFEHILSGLPNDLISVIKLLSAALRISELTSRFVHWGAAVQPPSELPLPYEVLLIKANNLFNTASREAWALPADLREANFPDLPKPREANHDEVDAVLKRLQKRQATTESRQLEIDRSVSELGVRVEQKFSQFELQAETAFTSMRSEFDREGKALLANYDAAKVELTNRRKAIDQLLGVLASKALGGGYMRNALKEEKLADRFRSAAVVLMVLLGICIVGAIVSMEVHSVTPEQVMVRGTGVLFFSFVIGYLIRQSAVHRAQQHRYQRTALDLKAIDPFLADLPLEARQAVKLQLADKIFVPKEVLAASDSAGFGWAEVAIKAIDKAKSVKEKSS
ncbi:hypothetical protein [Acidovorax sp. 1608163]|uniref:hypothetical protein n=1 Tax=Acidovorax sp. 1608163 TaxID=2478662 RepID=UPI0013CEE4A5|nr:hypothetical protein [Acidovorax sp. 1608163]